MHSSYFLEYLSYKALVLTLLVLVLLNIERRLINGTVTIYLLGGAHSTMALYSLSPSPPFMKIVTTLQGSYPCILLIHQDNYIVSYLFAIIINLFAMVMCQNHLCKTPSRGSPYPKKNFGNI